MYAGGTVLISHCKFQDTHKRLAEDLEDKGDYQAAEEQYMLAGDWKSAVNMYMEHEQWADAYRVARAEGGDRAHKQVAFLTNRVVSSSLQVVYMWAKSLGGDAAVRLLQRYGMLGEAINMAIEKQYVQVQPFQYQQSFQRIRVRLRTMPPRRH